MISAFSDGKASNEYYEELPLPEPEQKALADRDCDVAAKPFPLHSLPPAVEAMARAIAEAERAPESLAGCCVLGILSAAIGAGLQVRSGPQRVTRGNLYIVASAESGSGKSENFRQAVQPFSEFERALIEAWRATTLPGLQAERDILEEEIIKLKKMAGKADGALERDELKTQLEKKKADFLALEKLLHAPILSVEDTTSERLAVLLSQRGETLASLSPDAGAIVNNLLGRYSKLERTDETLYLKAYSGDSCKVDRQCREPVFLESPCISALWLVQPDKVETLLAERSLTDGGLIPRLLICHTRAQPRPIVEDATGIPLSVRETYHKMIRGLLETYRLSSEARTIVPSPKAVVALNAHYNGIVERRCGDLRDVTTFAARWNEQAWRIAVCLHAGRWGSRAHEQTLEIETAKDAIELADRFAAQQLEILNTGRTNQRLKRVHQLQLILANYGGQQSLRELARRHGFSHAEAKHLATEFPDLLTYEKKETGGRPSEILSKTRRGEK